MNIIVKYFLLVNKETAHLYGKIPIEERMFYFSKEIHAATIGIRYNPTYPASIGGDLG
jgi:hypothetical protein